MSMRMDLLEEAAKALDDFEYAGEVLGAIQTYELDSVEGLITHYRKLWENTEDVTDLMLERKGEGQVEINPGGIGNIYVRGKPIPFDIDKIIESLRSQEQYYEQILLALKKAFPKKFPQDIRFEQKTKPKP